MVSENKRQANRANSRSSTGPRTIAGKARSAKNARKHGLRVPVRADTALSTEVMTLVNKIAGPDAAPELRELAIPIAEAQVEVMRLRRARCEILKRAMSDPELQARFFKSAQPKARQTEDDPDEATFLAAAFAEMAPKFAVISSYERRALSRRKKAIRDFEEFEVGNAGIEF
jgi:hypothetical protein